MRFALFTVLLLAAACDSSAAAAGRSPQTPAEPGAPTVAIGRCQRATFSGACETFTWSIAGTLRGQLKATLRQFAEGKESLLCAASFAAADLAVDGQIVLVLREGPPLAAPGERSVELRMPVSPRTANAAGVWSAAAPSSAFLLPTTPLRTRVADDGRVLPAAPGIHDVVELWSETHAPAAITSGRASPWPVQRRGLLHDCVDGTVATVLTVEIGPGVATAAPASK